MAGITARFGGLIRRMVEIGQRLRVNITPNHYYSEYPDIRTLRRERYWREPWSMVGVAGAEPGPEGIGRQAEFVRSCCVPFAEDLRRGGIHERACERNGEGGYGPVEAEFLHCFIRARRPRRVVQVGCGVSTAVILGAAEAGGDAPEIVCVEPYPSPFLEREHGAGRIRLVREQAQKVPLDVLTSVATGDLLFIDSTHTARLGSEVPRLILEVLPRLVPGVAVHFHDIHFPYDYTPGVLDRELFFWRESVMLHAMLAMNPGYRIDASLSMLHHAVPDVLREAIPSFHPAKMVDARIVEPGHSPSSIFLSRV